MMVMTVPPRRNRYCVSQGTYGRSLLSKVADVFFTTSPISSLVALDMMKYEMRNILRAIARRMPPGI